MSARAMAVSSSQPASLAIAMDEVVPVESFEVDFQRIEKHLNKLL